eukprot:CAMPEP_0196727934 /NCGR_PEP_ID=MMETSP1091-20130531/8783_1 /TAXON_ID=302021 /ORGANISM="Rhodomonas sp., Strain CCMP768" /LENGTH=462 /DNA_ID=CAMNT_0042070619 /DNA_START=76 /DNA_END=1464 /DNA_ORIENTATION=+
MAIFGWSAQTRFSIIAVVQHAAWTFQARFVAPFLRSYGINKEEVGALLAAGFAIGMVAHPILAAVCDFTSIRPRTALFWCCLAAAAVMPIHLVPLIIEDNVMAWLLLARLSVYFFWMPVGTLLDTIFIYCLTTDEYGVIRLWSAATLGVWQPLLLGPMLDQFGYWIMVPGFSFVAVVLSICLLMLIDETEQQYHAIEKEKDEDKQNDTKTWLDGIIAYQDGIGRILWAEGWLSAVFYWTLFIMGGSTALVGFLVFLFWVEDLGATNSLCGLSVAVTVIFEIPLFYFTGSILRTFSLPYLLILAGLSYAVRVFVYTIVDSPWQVLLVEPLHGVTEAFFRLALIYYAKRCAPEGLQTTAQGLGHFLRDLGRVIATLVGGSVMEHFGAVTLYRAAVALMLFSIALLWIVYQLHPQYHDVLAPITDEPQAVDGDAAQVKAYQGTSEAQRIESGTRERGGKGTGGDD